MDQVRIIQSHKTGIIILIKDEVRGQYLSSWFVRQNHGSTIQLLYFADFQIFRFSGIVFGCNVCSVKV